MKIKFLPVIVSFFIISFTVASCLGSGDSVEYDPDATIKAFELDTIYGVNYKFTIDQLGGRIFNRDSVPVSADTIIDKILIKNINTLNYYIVTGDSVFNINDSVDFRGTMEKPLKFKVYSPDFSVTKDYEIELRIHTQDPDSLTWKKDFTATFPGSPFSNSKTVTLGNQLLVYISNTSLYSSSTNDGQNWELNANIQGLPTNIKLHSLIKHKDYLYIVNEDGILFESSDGINWQDSALGGKVISLLASLPTGISAIIENDGRRIFAVSDIENEIWQTTDEEVPANFPIDNISSASYSTPTGIIRSVIVGKSNDITATQTVPWFTLMDGKMDGKVWAAMSTSSDYYIPVMERPTVMYYAKKLYAYGDGFETFYNSEDGGLVWKKIEKKFMFPESFAGRKSYSSVVDDDNYIWIIWNNQGVIQNGVDKGRLNKLGFDIQD